MGDSGEGLVDNESRIQERMEELQRSREQSRKPRTKNPQLIRQLESLKLARKEMARQQDASTNEGRKSQIAAALADLDGRIAELQEQDSRS
jgi:hypothetical protein